MLRSSLLFALAPLAAGCILNLGMADGTTGGTSGPATTTTTATTLDPTSSSGTDPSSTSSSTTDKPLCGDGNLSPGEQCDDGNDTPDDGCEPDCTLTPSETCGNGTTDPGEECDDGNSINGDGCENNCTVTVISPTCGDGMINDASEACDDGNDNNNDACTNACKQAYCGDGIVQEGVDQCDDGGASATCDADCTPAMCGDGVTNTAAGEECDDMNVDNTDACLSTCKNAFCGDLVVQAGVEECDDGSPGGDDLCNQCKISPFRYIFVTTATFNGDLNGAQGADNTCFSTALDAGIPGADESGWVAWVSMNTSQVSQRADTAYTGWYVLPTDPLTPVAKGWAGLTSGTLLHAIDHTEIGLPLIAPTTVWTNTGSNGMLPVTNLHCNNWNSTLGTGRVGLATATTIDWTDPMTPASADCTSAHHLYCIQDPP